MNKYVPVGLLLALGYHCYISCILYGSECLRLVVCKYIISLYIALPTYFGLSAQDDNTQLGDCIFQTTEHVGHTLRAAKRDGGDQLLKTGFQERGVWCWGVEFSILEDCGYN